jgi:hypothetical protein
LVTAVLPSNPSLIAGPIHNEDGNSASRVTKTSTREKKPAMAAAGKRGDMDDEIPF